MNEELHICLACDENYRRGLWVTAASLLESNRNSPIVLHILDGGLLSRSALRLRRIAERVHPKVEVKFHPLDDSVFSVAPMGPGNSRMTYARLLCGSLFRDLSRIVYVDVDMLVNADLGATCVEMPDGAVLAGSVCPVVGTLAKDCAWPLEASETSSPYLNGGFLSVNLDAWREAGIEEAALELIRTDPDHCRFHDQTVINYVCRGRMALLPDRFNLPPDRWREAGGPLGGVIHYLAPEKPWAVWRPDPAYQLWRAAWRRHVGPGFLLLLSPAMAMSALRFFALGVARHSGIFAGFFARVVGLRCRLTRDPVKRRILERYRESILGAPGKRIESVDPAAFFDRD